MQLLERVLGVLARRQPDAEPRGGGGHDLVRRPGDRVRVEPDHRQRRAHPEPLVRRRRRVAHGLDTFPRAVRVEKRKGIAGKRSEPRLVDRRGRGDIAREAVDRDRAMFVDHARKQAREGEHRIGHETARHPAVHRSVERPHGDIGRSETAQ